MLQVDQKVPDYMLEAYHEDKTKTIQFSEYSGKWLVLLFYPADFTFVCPTELEEAAERYDEFKKEEAEIISISTDTVFVHKAWHDNSPAIKKIQYPMAADPTGKISRAFGTYISEEGLSRRASYIIDPDGKIVCYEMHWDDIGRNIAEILRKLKAAKFVRENEGLVCPASWQPGGKTLKPGLELVGQI